MQTDHREELAVGGKALFEMLALKPEWGKPAFWNFREGDGNGGIIRSPIRAIALPDKVSGSYQGNHCLLIGLSQKYGKPARLFVQVKPCR